VKTPPTRKTEQRSRIFLSYARADGVAFVSRLAQDLRDNGQHVWVDLESIEPGGPFDARIEDGIRKAHVVLALMTRGSVSEQSVCRDEVTFALNQRTMFTYFRLKESRQGPTTCPQFKGNGDSSRNVKLSRNGLLGNQAEKRAS